MRAQRSPTSARKCRVQGVAPVGLGLSNQEQKEHKAHKEQSAHEEQQEHWDFSHQQPHEKQEHWDFNGGAAARRRKRTRSRSRRKLATRMAERNAWRSRPGAQLPKAVWH